MKKRNRAVFLDRDGTILTERGYLADPRKMVFYPNIFGPLKNLRKRGYKLIVITNQSGIARGYFTLAMFNKINAKFNSVMAKHGALIERVYFCPHGPNDGCGCRKPKTLLMKRAARDFGIDLTSSFVVGDQTRDVQMARRAGARGILVLTGAGRSVRKEAEPVASKVTANLSGACRWILKQKDKS